MSRRLKRDERFEAIIAGLRARPTVRISELAEAFGVSTETVRRDIDALSERGLVDRTYGGAAIHPRIREPAFNERYRQRVAERQRIGDEAAAMVEDGDVLMVDAGSTTTRFAQALAATSREATVVTNCVGIALALGETPGLRVVLCPGDYNAREGGVFGPDAVDFLGRFHADKAFVGASGVTADGPVEGDSAAAWIKRSMIARAARSILLVDHGKFGARALEVVCPLAELDDIVTDAAPDDGLARSMCEAGVTLHLGAPVG